MPSSFSHAMIAVAAGSAVAPRPLLRPFLIVGAACAVIPDLDAIGRPFYKAAGDFEFLGGHRGFTHSLTFAVMLGAIAGLATMRDARWSGTRLRFAIFVALATASHGALDALTSIGATTSPVQFFSPFSTRGYTSPWHPIHGPFSELFLLFLPLFAMTRLTWRLRQIPWPRRRVEEPVTLDLHSQSE